MTTAEINFVENTTKPYRELVECSLCHTKMTPKQMRFHVSEAHNISPQAVEWLLNGVLIEEDDESFLVTFKASFVSSSLANGFTLQQLIENYYHQLNNDVKTQQNLQIHKNNIVTKKDHVAIDGITYLIWDHIIFDKDLIRFNHNALLIAPVVIPGIVPELNEIKQSFFYKRKELLKFKLVKGVVNKEESPGYRKILEVLDLATESLHSFNMSKEAKNNIVLPPIEMLTNKQILDTYKNHIRKSEYINILAAIHDDRYQLVPILEIRNSLKEVSFIFTHSNGNNIYLIWESCSENRGTHIFKIPANNYKAGITKLKSYITDPDIINKRKLFWQSSITSKKIKKKLQYFTSLKHNNKNDFLRMLESFD